MADELLYKLFEEKNFKPNENQEKAILHLDGPLYLVAGPGSGKTRVLLWKTLNLIVFHNIKPEEIFLSTFTEKAALQLKQGLQGLLSIASKYTGKPYDIAEMYIGTLHSLCQKLLDDRRFNIGRGRTHRPVILDDLDQFFFVGSNWEEILAAGNLEATTESYAILNSWFEFSLGKHSKTNAIKNCISFFNRMSEEDFDDDVLRNKKSGAAEKALLEMTIKYRELLNTNHRVDFANLQRQAFNNISRDDVFKYVIIDEYQDTNTIQQKIYLKLSNGNKNICVVGDDDQALYRFRGATVENFINFENICRENLKVNPTRIDLNTNYRSREQIVKTYTEFIETCDWTDKSKTGQNYRFADKKIQAFNDDKKMAVLLEKGKKEDVADKIVNMVKHLKESGKITDYNQCAFLFPTLKGNFDGMSASVKAFTDAFEKAGIPFYAPRAKNVLYTEEFLITFGLFAKIFKISGVSFSSKEYNEWLEKAISKAEEIIEKDSLLDEFIIGKWTEIEIVKKNYKILADYCAEKGWDLKSAAFEQTTKVLAFIPKLDSEIKKVLLGSGLNNYIRRKNDEGKPVSLQYILSRVTSLDWTLLDLFYQLNAFNYFEKKYLLAEKGEEDSAMYNFGMITQYISKFMEMSMPILSGKSFQENSIPKRFFNSYLYTLYRLGETEFEDADDPFPKGCVPFLTVHQAKGLEFPVVVIGSVQHKNRNARPLDVFVRMMLAEQCKMPKICEPLDKMDMFDTMRLFYVAISRAKNLCIISQITGVGYSTFIPMTNYLDTHKLEDIDSFDFNSLSVSTDRTDELTHIYTYTADYLPYKNCPRNYMVFKKYGFVPSRSQTMFFGSLVHATVEDLQNFIIGGLIQ